MSKIDVESGAAIAVAEIGDSVVSSCPACSHPAESHDVIARRFCTATQAGTFNRGCVCAGGPEKAVTAAMRVSK
ncbi:RGCVC family protein [Amycolatopsis sp. lyj-346]|uniref:RGCVC family protein n=1 Tax=Amycolatopsis sp. lyj-346 TaxID=2789289 RepID=UPI00397AC33C